MLLRFGVQNFRSIKDRQEISLIPSSLDDVKTGLIECGAAPGGRVLPAAIIYGANAAGKSNLVSALEWMNFLILNSHSRGEPGGRVPRPFFRLNPESAKTSSGFDVDFVVEGVRYRYEVEASDEAFVGERLYAYPNERRQMLFERENMNFVFGRGLRGQNKIISELTRPNSLFLSAAAQNSHETLSNISGFFRNIDVDTEISVSDFNIAKYLSKGSLDRRTVNFLSKIKTGVVGHRVRTMERSKESQEFANEFLSFIKKMTNQIKKATNQDINIESMASSMEIAYLELAHRGVDGKLKYFNLRRESDGTRRLLVLLEQIFPALDVGSVVVCDELNASLHTQAAEALIALFSSPSINPKGAQLIATTHDTNLLRSPFLRRDQVWFTEKDEEGATHLYPLTDIRTRKGDNIERGYLQGRYGAVPFSGSVSELLSAD